MDVINSLMSRIKLTVLLEYISIFCKFSEPDCNKNFGPGKKRSGWTIFGRLKLVRGDQIWLPKLVRPNQKWSGVEYR